MKTFFLMLLMSLSLSACSTEKEISEEVEEIIDPVPDSGKKAEVVMVSVTGDEGAYTFSVTIKSPDTGCNQYADWWEIITLQGDLLYRRILAHSHVNEQPFVRSGGPVVLKKDQEVYVRAHMNNSGYGEKIYKGTVEGGFSAFELESKFDEELEKKQPLPTGCAF